MGCKNRWTAWIYTTSSRWDHGKGNTPSPPKPLFVDVKPQLGDSDMVESGADVSSQYTWQDAVS